MATGLQDGSTKVNQNSTVLSLEAQKKLARQQRGTCKAKLTRKLEKFHEYLVGEVSLEILEGSYESVSKAYEEVELANEQYCNLLDEDSDSVLINEANVYIKELEDRKCAAHVTFVKMKEKVNIKSHVKVKPIDVPRFQGDVREYSNFKRDFVRLVQSNYGNDPFVLRQCLSGEALETVRGSDHDFDKMFERLDETFGNCRRVIDVVVEDIRSIKPIAEGDNAGFIKMVDKIEQCFLYLDQMNLASELNTANMTSQIEKLLPSTQKREWVKLADGISSHDLFGRLLEYLLSEKKSMKYLSADVRNSERVKCKVNYTCMKGDEVGSEEDKDSELMKRMAGLETAVAKINTLVTKITEEKNEVDRNRRYGSTSRQRCWYHASDGHDISDCFTFQNLSISDKMECLRANGICFNCLKGTHVARRCFWKSRCNATGVNNDVCGKLHHTSLHEGFLSTKSNVGARSNGVLFMVNKINCGNYKLNTLFDSGADMTMIRNEMANTLGLKGRSVRLAVTKLGNHTVTYQSKEYDLILNDKYGNEINIIAYGIDAITSHIDKVDLTNVKNLFKSVDVCSLDRPHGEIDLLIGSDYCSLIPRVKETVAANLQLMESPFGMCVFGSHPDIITPQNERSNLCIRINHVSTTIHDIDIAVEPAIDIHKQIKHFFDVEYLGTECTPKCGGCRCGKCAVGNGNYSIREEKELALIEEGLSYNSEQKEWSSKFPWIKDPKLLPNNEAAAIARLKGTEKRLLKLGPEYAEAYNNQILDMVNRNVARKLSNEEAKNYPGPITYIQHHEVLRPGSVSTPLRIVFDSSAKYMGQSLNSFLAKGPNILNSMIGILLRFRENFFGVAGDISKMYNCIKLPELEQHVHRFIWREFQMHRKPDHYVLTALGFGDRPSGIIAMLALRHTAELSRNEFPEASYVIEHNSYVDDIIHSVESKEKALTLIADAENVLSRGKFKIKEWVISGNEEDADHNISRDYCEKILGLNWRCKEDLFCFKTKINFSKKYKGVRTDPNLNKVNLAANIPSVLTKRIVVSQMCSVYDPLGLLLPFTLKGKILLRDTVQCELKLGWDDPLPLHMKDQWVSYFNDLFDIETMQFERCVKPISAKGQPMLIIFSDSSTNAYGAVAYIRWELESGTFKCRLLMAKNRIAPTRKLSIPRLELCGAVIACRMRKIIEDEMTFKFSSVMHITDSSIVRAQVQKESHGFGTFVATRVAEVQSNSNPNEWWWITTELNPADLLTRTQHPLNDAVVSVWNDGPEFMNLPLSSWPISKSIDCEIPERVQVNLAHYSGCEETIINASEYENYNKLMAVTARILNVVKLKSLKGVRSQLESENFREAELFWIRQAQKYIPENWKECFKRLGPFRAKDGIIMVGQRIENWLKLNWNQDCFVLLPGKHPFTILYIKYLHKLDHAGVDVTLCKLQAKYWVPSARKIIKSVKNKCVTCKKLDSKVEGQSMGQISDERLKPCPPFYHTALDIFGPFQIKDNVKKRTTGKAFGVIFNCMVTRAVYIDVVDGYDTCSFLKSFRRFISIHGYPYTVHSDLGSQLVSASKEIKNAIDDWNMSDLTDFGNSKGLKWKFNRSADAAWQNGISEALIKSVKRSLSMIIGCTRLTISDLQTVFFEIANLMNERPIGAKPGMDVTLGTYLCPNDLVLGRASNNVPSGLWSTSSNIATRLQYIQNVVDTFWRKWQRDYFPTLIVRQKWHVDKRNLQPGDIVLIQDANAVRGKWRMGQVIDVNVGRDEKVRDVTVRYKIQKPGINYKGQGDTIIKRSVHKLVVLLPTEEQ